MAMTFAGYRYIKTSAGYIKVMYFTETGSYNYVTYRSFDQALANAHVTSYDGSIGLARKQGGTLGASGITIGNQVTTISGNTLYLGASVIGNIGQYADTYNLACMILFRDGSGKYILCSFSPVNETAGGTVLPRAGSWGYYAGPISRMTTAFGYNYYNAELNTFLNNNPPKAFLDPYDAVGATDAGGAEDATYDFTTTDDIAVPNLPTLSAANTGFISLWKPTIDQMLDLSSYMWNANPLVIDFWKKLIADPFDLILGLNIIPLELTTSGTGSVTVGLINTGIIMDILSSQYVELDCGSIDIDETWGAYIDYDPFTKIDIFLPYCGMHPLRVDDFMPGTLSLKYHIDLLSGACVAMLTSTKSASPHNDTLDSVVYQFTGNVATQIPITASQYADAVRSAITIAASVGSLVAGVGAGSSIQSGVITSLAENNKLTEHSYTRETHGANHSMQTGASAIENVMNIKPSIERSGAIGGNAGLLGVQIPYIVLTRPRQAHPDKQNTYTGYPSFITRELGELSGLTLVHSIHLSGISCTDEELAEIDALLTSGVIL